MGQALPPELLANHAWRTQFSLNFSGEKVVDLFAGGGGASTGLEMALGRPVDVAINHDPDAISMHRVNHPHTRHYISDVYEVDPLEACEGSPVGHLHASPDCTHFSQAKGGQARKRALRSLSWVVHKWAGAVRPRIITLENVEQILQWSPLVAKRCRKTGRVLRLDGRVAAPGERVPVDQQFLVPDRRRKGHNWRHFVQGLRAMGYAVEWRSIPACVFGAPTTRKRLYLVARCDGQPIVWPSPTHAAIRGSRVKAYATGADCIDWSVPSQSIFGRPKPLAVNTLRRVAKGMGRFVLDAAKPFIVPIANYGAGDSVHSLDEPLRTITAWPKGGSFSLVAPTLVKFRFDSGGAPLTAPLPTITAGGACRRPAGAAHALGISVAFLAQHNNHRGSVPSSGRAITAPLSTVTVRGSQQGLVTARLAPDPLDLARATFRPVEPGAGLPGAMPAIVVAALRVAAFLAAYGDSEDRPFASLTLAERLELVTVRIDGERYLVVDIHLRMLQPRELYRAQGFPDSYEIERGHDGRVFTKSKQVHFVGNSVSPLPMAAIVAANHRQAGTAAEPAACVA